jgi:nitrile hydratase
MFLVSHVSGGSTAETCYLGVPVRQPGAEGWSEVRLASLISRDSMIGTGLARSPDGVAA